MTSDNPMNNKVEPSQWAQIWNQKNDTYQDLIQKVAPLRRTVKLQMLISENEHVLETGCGDGKFVFYFNSLGYNFKGIDFSESTIARCVSIAESADIDKNIFDSADIRNLQKYKEQFEVYLSMGVIEHFEKEDQKQIVKNALLSLKPGGRAIIIVPNFFSPWTFTRLIMARLDKNMVYQKNISTFKIKKMFEAGGFETIEVYNDDVRESFSRAYRLGYKKIKGVPNPFYYLRKVLLTLADVLEKILPIIGHNTYYIGQKKS